MAADADIESLRRSFENPPDDARIMVRWWWFGPAVTKPELEREMRAMKAGRHRRLRDAAGLPADAGRSARGFRNFPYLSDEFLDDAALHRGEGARTGAALGPDAGQRMALRRPAHPHHPGGRRLRVDRVPVPADAATVRMPTVADGEKFIAAFLADGDAGSSRRGHSPAHRIATGAVRLPAPTQAEPRVVLFFISSRTARR